MKETSILAHRSMLDQAKIHRKVVYETMKKIGKPCTPEQVSNNCYLRYDQVWRRFSELKKEGLIRETGIRTINSSGRSAELCEVVHSQLKLF